MLPNIGDIHNNTRFRIKDREKALIYNAIYSGSATTRKKISTDIQIRPTTTSNVVKELLNDGLITEHTVHFSGKKGRPTTAFIPNHNRFVAGSIDIISHTIRGSLLNVNQSVIFEKSIFVGHDADKDTILTELCTLVSLIKTNVPEGSLLTGIGIALPGTVDKTNNQWIAPARWNSIDCINMNELAESIDVPVSIERLLDARLTFQLMKNPKFQKGSTLLVHWGYGIGAAFAYNGVIMRSTWGAFGEIGHWSLYPPMLRTKGKPCICGAYGCVESETALWALLPEIKKIYPQVPEDELQFSDFIIDHDYTQIPGVERALAQMIHTLTKIFEVFYPDRMLLYGPFLENDRIFSALVAGIEPHNFFTSDKNEMVIRTSLRNSGERIGCVYSFFYDTLRTYLSAYWE